MRGAARIVILSALAGCVGGPYMETAAEATGATTGGTTGGAVTSGTPTTGGPSTTGGPPATSDEPATSDGECIFHSECTPDGGPGPACNLWVQDCAPGQKCVPYGSSWESTQCVPIAPNPGEPGEPCTVEGEPGSGIDDCALGGICLGTGDGDLEGTCTAMCRGFPNKPECVDATTTCIQIASVGLCSPPCHPLANDCAAGLVCVSLFDSDSEEYRFFCVLDTSGGGGQEFDECEYINDCDPGLACGYSGAAVECEQGVSKSCCLKYCDLSQPDCDGMMAECLPWYGMEQPPMGYENVGVCAIPR